MAGLNGRAHALVDGLGLSPLEGEGGFFARVHTFCGDDGKVSGSTILYLMTHADYSRFHRLTSDEVWYHLEGSPVEQLTLEDNGSYTLTVLGRASEGRVPVATVRAGSWQASRPIGEEGWALCAATMMPAWSEGGFALVDHHSLAPWAHCPHLGRFVEEE